MFFTQQIFVYVVHDLISHGGHIFCRSRADRKMRTNLFVIAPKKHFSMTGKRMTITTSGAEESAIIKIASLEKKESVIFSY